MNRISAAGLRSRFALVLLGLGLAACSGPAPAPPATAAQIEDLARAYYASLADYDFAAMNATTTPEFEATEHSGTFSKRFDRSTFEERIKGAQQAGAVLKFELSDFNTRVAEGAAYTSYMETGTNGAKYYAGMAFVLVDETWLADRLYTLPVLEPAAGSPVEPAPAAN